MNININQRVKCNLTDSGREVYQAYLDQFHCQSEAPAEVVMPLWEFCQIFGNVLFLGQTAAPFTQDNEIELIDLDLN